ncbi:hypothetical protein BpHYR1_014974, partial [Brachionus plicatilis]
SRQHLFDIFLTLSRTATYYIVGAPDGLKDKLNKVNPGDYIGNLNMLTVDLSINKNNKNSQKNNRDRFDSITGR